MVGRIQISTQIAFRRPSISLSPCSPSSSRCVATSASTVRPPITPSLPPPPQPLKFDKQLQLPQRKYLNTRTIPSTPHHEHMDHPHVAGFLTANAQWAQDVANAEPTFFEDSAKGQAPKILWIGCADSRVPESVIMAARPGDLFVHRNIANQFHSDDDSALSVLAYAVDFVGVEHVVIVGHTCCGGAAACFDMAVADPAKSDIAQAETPLMRWLTPLTNLARQLELGQHPKDVALPILVEENVKMQVENVLKTDTIRNAWARGRSVHVHGWVYQIEAGRIRELGISSGPDANLATEKA